MKSNEKKVGRQHAIVFLSALRTTDMIDFDCEAPLNCVLSALSSNLLQNTIRNTENIFDYFKSLLLETYTCFLLHVINDLFVQNLN